MVRIRMTERSAGPVYGTLVDESGAAVPGSRVTAILLTLYDKESVDIEDGTPTTADVINERLNDDVLGSGEATVNESGAFVLHLTADDLPIVNRRRQVERHVAVLAFAWTNVDDSVGSVKVPIEIEVENVGGVI